jgi:hypothetical protein
VSNCDLVADCSEQFYTDLRWSMSAWLLQQRFDTHDKTSLGAPNRRFAIPQADWHLSLGVGHNEHLLHHRCGGRDHSRRRFFGPALRKSCKPCSRAVSSGRGTGARHRAFGFWVAGATLIVAKPGEQFYTDAVDQRAHPSRIKPPSKVTPRRNTSGANGGRHARFATLPR